MRALVLLALSSTAWPSPTQPVSAFEEEAPKEAPREEEPVQTEHELRIDGTVIRYTARTGRMLLKEDGDTPKAEIFFVAYEKTDVADRRERPLTFCFNGGPGSSSVWLHMGAFGPRRVPMGEVGSPPVPPFELIDNVYSLLDLTDLVFVDPVTTGYSRAVEGEEDEQFHGVEEDVRWMAEFLRLFTTRFERWDSPKYIAGESYGTTRAVGLAQELQSRHGMFLNGLILVSSILRFQTARFDSGNDLPYVLFLPTYCATAWYHGKLDAELQADLRRTLDEVEAFALGEYASALLQGDDLAGEEREAIAARLARYTGLSPTYVEETNLRIKISRFVKELMRDQRTTVGRLDSRFSGHDADAAGESYEYDPSYSVIQGPYTAAVNDYLRTELNYRSEVPYEILTGRVHPWQWKNENSYLDMGETLRQAMTQNPHLRVFVANGYYDLATPYFATERTFAHLGLEPSLRGNVTMGHYEAGHMMYIHEPSIVALKQDLAAFYGATGR